jgi:gliding motility-associated lipoprotein GldD
MMICHFDFLQGSHRLSNRQSRIIRSLKSLFGFIALIFFLAGCRENYTPKPKGFIRIDFPEKRYNPIQEKFPYRFEIPEYALVMPDDRNPGKTDWINVSIPGNMAEIHVSYYPLDRNKQGKLHLAGYIEESRELAYKHSIKADAIDERLFINKAARVFGTVYKIKGNAASPVQFYLTDSLNHFLRGALYIRSKPDIDSLKPVIQFLETDVIHLIETTSWK